MWSIGSTAPLNCVYLGYAIGALLSIIIVRSFRQNDSLSDNNMKYSNSTIVSRQGRFQLDLVGPYAIASVFCLITSIGFAYIAYKQYKIKKESTAQKLHTYKSVAKEEINIESKRKRLFNKGKFLKTCSPATCGQGYIAYGFILMSLLLLYYFLFGKIFIFFF